MKSKAAAERPPSWERFSVSVVPLVPCAVTSPEAVVWPTRTRPALASSVALVELTALAVPKA